MALISLAIDYKKTPIEVRSDFALSGENISDLYGDFIRSRKCYKCCDFIDM